MLHACFVYDPTCFMCLFIQYLALSKTNLLTRCHSASSCFLLFLYFRKVVQEIFSELNGTNCQHLIITKGRLCQKMTGGGSARWPDPTRRGQPWARAGVASGPTLAPPTPPLRLFILLFGKTLGRQELFHEKFRSRRHLRTRLGRVLELFPASCRREKSPPEAFFITMPASAMMYEESTTGLRVHSSS